MSEKFYCRIGKRCLDVTVSICALVVLSPVLAISGLAVRLTIGKPIIFQQSRPGKHEKLFNLYKFRTMTNERDVEGNLLPDKERIVPLGSFLRKTSIDELPELFNILKGDMSLVGPRPLLERYGPYYTADEMKRFEVLPGLTGWAQIHGRNNVSWNERLSYDTWYSENVSFIIDCRILLKTLQMVFKREGVVVVPDSKMRSLDVERTVQ